jgi:hypothetical protein
MEPVVERRIRRLDHPQSPPLAHHDPPHCHAEYPSIAARAEFLRRGSA